MFGDKLITETGKPSGESPFQEWVSELGEVAGREPMWTGQKMLHSVGHVCTSCVFMCEGKLSKTY